LLLRRCRRRVRDGGWRRSFCARGGDCAEFCEKIIRHFAGGAVDQPRANLGELAADRRIHVVFQNSRVGSVGLKLNQRAAFRESSRTPCALARDAIAVGRVQILQLNPAAELGAHRANLCPHTRFECILAVAFEFFAASDGFFQRFRIIQRVPNNGLWRWDARFALHIHG
jgi:hypothetical protein